MEKTPKLITIAENKQSQCFALEHIKNKEKIEKNHKITPLVFPLSYLTNHSHLLTVTMNVNCLQ